MRKNMLTNTQTRANISSETRKRVIKKESDNECLVLIYGERWQKEKYQ